MIFAHDFLALLFLFLRSFSPLPSIGMEKREQRKSKVRKWKMKILCENFLLLFILCRYTVERKEKRKEG